MMTVLVLVMLRRRKVGDGDVEEEGDCEGSRVDVAADDDHDDDGGVGYDFKEGGWRR